MKEKQRKLKKIAERVEKCTRCRLFRKATKSVPGAGRPDAEMMFIGEGPGFHEDQQGLPFVGASGKLLDKLLALINLKRDEVFIGNVIKHRPPGNRDPLPEEIKACQPFLEKQIEIINPKMIVTLGRFSMAQFLPDEKISQIHGQARFVDWQGKRLTVLPMYHPAAALRRGEMMNQIKEDFKKIPQLLESQEDKDFAEEPIKEEKKREQLSLINGQT
ncbi:MAG TPA: uracil-DNA glycosylase [Candidatus Bathyarchaeia archaeon]|nr:uracil-DNA glycosylase [Candidatus Bathyarchaeia archaeon]